jgi:hypothetical protein
MACPDIDAESSVEKAIERRLNPNAGRAGDHIREHERTTAFEFEMGRELSTATRATVLAP